MNKESAKYFYKNAIDNMIDNKPVSILKISDYNTTGFTNDGYYAFLKSVGVSTKSTGGGSWGLGKGSYFASSTFRTIFVTSIKKSGEHIFQGKLFLSSWINDTGETMDGTGSYGYENQEPVTAKSDIPEIFRRDEQGTDFYVLGFMEKSNWEEQIIESVMINFWPAIYDNRLIVEVGDKPIHSKNIEGLIVDFFSTCQDRDIIELNPLPYLYAYKNPDHLFSGNEEDYPTLKAMQLYVLFGDDYLNKIAYARTPRMIVQTRGSYYSQKSCAAFFICDNPDGDAILRDMENPEHNEWNKSNPDPDPKTGKPYSKYLKAEQELKDFIKRSFDELIKEEASEELDIRDLENYLWLPTEEDMIPEGEMISGGDLNDKISQEETGSQTGSIEDSKLRKKIKVSPISKIVTESKMVLDEEGEIDIIGGNGGGGNHHGQKGTKSEDGENRKVSIPIKYRTFVPRSIDGKQSHILIIRGTQNTNCNIELKAGTDNSFLPISIKKVTGPNEEKLDFENNILKNIPLGPNGKIKLKIVFRESGRYSLKAEAYANI